MCIEKNPRPGPLLVGDGVKANRRPAHLEFAGGKSPRQRIWEKIRAYHAGQAEPFTLNRLVADMPGTIHKDTTRTYVMSLAAGGYLQQIGVYFHLIKDNGVEAPRVRKDGSEVTQGRAQENMWRTLRSLNHTVSCFELASMASTPEHPVSNTFATDYLLNLHKAGYLNKIGLKYHLNPAMNTGPRPPMIQRIKQVYDPNVGKVMWKQETSDD
jgi:hypothetical protein